MARDRMRAEVDDPKALFHSSPPSVAKPRGCHTYEEWHDVTYEEAKERLSFEIDHGVAMKRLVENKDFIEL